MGRSSAHRRRRGVEAAVAALAGRQYGCVSLEQLRGVGLSPTAVHKRVEAGRLRRVHQRVYALEREPRADRGRLMAAVLACGTGALLSHRSAAELWSICEPKDGPIDVTAPNRRGRAPQGIAAHRDRSLGPGDRTVLHGIPCATVPRTLLDFAATATLDELRAAVAQAEVLKLVRRPLVREQIRRHPGRRGVARLRLVLNQIHADANRTRSELEIEFLEMCAAAALPPPEVNTQLVVGSKRLEVDFLWREAGLIVEADSRRFHDTASAFLSDRQRDQRLQLGGWRVTRCTWEQVEFERRTLTQTIRGLLALPTGRKQVN